MNFALAVAIAVSFWGERGVTVPCQPVPVPGADAVLARDRWGNPNAMEAAPGCRVLISSVAQAQRRLKDTKAWYCGYVAHEVGHFAGLSHTPHGLMSEDMFWEDIPYDCVHYKRFARKHRSRSAD